MRLRRQLAVRPQGRSDALARALAVIGALGAIAVSGAGCKKGNEKPVVIEPPDLQMVSQGNEPRKLLAYHIAKGTNVGLEVEVDMAVNAGEMGGPLPTIVTSMLVAVEDVQPDGQMKIHTTIVDAQAREREGSSISAAALAAPLDAMKGLAIETLLAPNGRVKKGEVQGGKQLPDDVAQQLTALSSTMEQVMMPLPAEPVGVGAVWRSSREIQQNGMKLTSVNTFALTAIDGDKLTYTLETDVHGANQTIKQADQSIEMTDITGTGAGKGSFSLSKLEISSEIELEFRSQMATPGDPAPTQMKMSMQTRIHPNGAPPLPSPAAGSGGSASAAGSDSAAAGSNAAGSNAAGSNAAGSNAAGSNAAGSNAAGSNASGSNAATGSASDAGPKPKASKPSTPKHTSRKPAGSNASGSSSAASTAGSNGDASAGSSGAVTGSNSAAGSSSAAPAGSGASGSASK